MICFVLAPLARLNQLRRIDEYNPNALHRVHFLLAVGVHVNIRAARKNSKTTGEGA
jgi:hypothetical protein